MAEKKFARVAAPYGMLKQTGVDVFSLATSSSALRLSDATEAAAETETHGETSTGDFDGCDAVVGVFWTLLLALPKHANSVGNLYNMLENPMIGFPSLVPNHWAP